MNRILAGCVAAGTLAATFPIAHAQQDSIDEVVVTATRRAVVRDDLAEAVTVIADSVIADEPLVTGALAHQPGVFLQETTPGQGAAIIRGVRGSAVLHLVDGMRLNNAIFRSAPTQYLALVPASAIERIEILRGTPASLYGTDAIGGAVQLVTYKPVRGQPGARGEVQIGFDTASMTRLAHTRLDLGGESIAATISAQGLTSGDRRIGGGERIGPSGYDAWGGRAAVAGQLVDDWQWLVDWQFMEQPDTPRVDELVPGFDQTTPASAEFAFTPNRRQFLHAQLQRDGGWLDLDWRGDIAWQRIDDDRTTRAFSSDVRRVEGNTSDLYGLTLSAGRTQADGSWIAGIEHYEDRISSVRSEQNLGSGASTRVAPRFPDGSSVRQTSLYGNLARTVSPHHRFNGGVRISNTQATLAAAGPGSSSSLSVTDIGADVGWQWLLNDTWRWVTNAGLGFRAPNIFDLGTLGERPGNRFNIPNPALDSERARQLDTGIRFADDRTRFELTLFVLDYTKRISSVPTGDITADGREVVTSANAAASTVYGLELFLDHQFNDRWRTSAVLNATRARQRDAGAASEPGDRIPPLNARLGFHYHAERWQLEAMITANAAQNRLSARDTNDPRIDPAGTAGWVSADLRWQWNGLAGWQVTTGVENLLDAQYREHGSGLDAPGRNLFLTLRRSL
ncbi:MAG: TonB-dependent receptor [Pseudomonadota bacterium]